MQCCKLLQRVQSAIRYSSNEYLGTKIAKVDSNDITACLFGGSGILGCNLASQLIHSGTRVILPYRDTKTLLLNEAFRSIHAGKFGFTSRYLMQNFTDHQELSVVLRDANCVICCLGDKFNEKKLEEYEKANILIPREIAKVASKNPNIKRFIYFSCTGADPASPLRKLRTKWYGEQEVRYYFPNATIIRPTMLYNTFFPYNGFVGKFIYSVQRFSGAMIGTGGGKCVQSPTCASDVSTATLNALLNPKTAGQIYELGGPQEYKFDELLEYFFNYIRLDPYVFELPLEYSLYHLMNSTSKWVYE